MPRNAPILVLPLDNRAHVVSFEDKPLRMRVGFLLQTEKNVDLGQSTET